MRRLLTALFAGAVASALVFSAVVQAQTVDWKKQEAEILRHHRALIQIDSSSPPGNEPKVADYLKRILPAEGIAVKTFALQPDRANLVARLKGSGKKRPLLLR